MAPCFRFFVESLKNIVSLLLYLGLLLWHVNSVCLRIWQHVFYSTNTCNAFVALYLRPFRGRIPTHVHLGKYNNLQTPIKIHCTIPIYLYVRVCVFPYWLIAACAFNGKSIDSNIDNHNCFCFCLLFCQHTYFAFRFVIILLCFVIFSLNLFTWLLGIVYGASKGKMLCLQLAIFGKLQ